MLKQFKPELKIEVQKFTNSNEESFNADRAAGFAVKKTEGCKCCEANSLTKKG